MNFFCILVLLIFLGTNVYGEGANRLVTDIPISTQWLLDSAGDTNRATVESVFIIINNNTFMKGTGFLIDSGIIITNEHVIRDATSSDLVVTSSYGKEITIKNIKSDKDRDLAILFPNVYLPGGLKLSDEKTPSVGTMVSTWGFPLGYNGPAPLLSVGYLSGYSTKQIQGKQGTVKQHLVVNGAFNPGNSGGPLFKATDNKVIGIVVSKHAPLTPFIKLAIDALSKNKSGVNFTGTDNKGNKINYVESQIVAKILEFYRNLTQVMIGEAISVSELKEFLRQIDVM
jgi:S1-C subfamily serine protease